MPDALDELVAALGAEDPPRVWSLLITVFGDAVAPRGGAVSSATLGLVTGRLGIGSGAVRTALSRLARDGWLERERRGRRSHYSLSASGRAPFAAASRRIYAPADAAPDARPRLLAIGARGTGGTHPPGEPDDGTAIELRAGLWLLVERDAAQRARLAGAGYLVASAVPGPMPGWLAERLGLAALDARCRRLRERFGALAARPPTEPLDALAARLLLVHAWRRLLLRAPVLPPALAPDGWALPATRAFVAALYRALLPASERWLDDWGEGPDGPLPPADGAVRRRFSDGVGEVSEGDPEVEIGYRNRHTVDIR